MNKLVMIDDNPMEHMIIQRRFDNYHIFPDAAHSLDGRVIIDFLRDQCLNAAALPDVIFLDLNMPDFSGWDFLEQLEHIYKHFPNPVTVYIMSSSVDEQDKLKVFRYPFVKEFISKPVTKEKLQQLYTLH
jgi:CheY-like chemotaxis protein